MDFLEQMFTRNDSRSNEKWDRRFLQLAKEVSTWSKDPSTQVGAVLVNPLNQVVGVGYNGFPRGVADTDERLNHRETKYKLVVHAEANAVLAAGSAARGATLYVYPKCYIPFMCHDCCKTVIQAGVTTVVGYLDDETQPKFERWKESIGIARVMWAEYGGLFRSYTE